MARSLGSLREAVRRRLGDAAAAIWSNTEIERVLTDAYEALAQDCRVFWDWVYAENLPRGFSYSQPWEATYLTHLSGLFDYGCANYSATFEAEYLPQDELIGPANHTHPDEIGHLDAVGASTAIPATSEVPENLTELARGVWDERGIDALTTRDMRNLDSRYRVTEGEVYGLLWEFDGIRTIRKVRVPAQQADTATIDGSWGALRDPNDLSTDTVTGTWGIPRRIAGQHPMGPERFGLPRRPYLDGMNVRLEHWRQGRAMDAITDLCELPDRYALYLRDFAQAACLRRAGPGQDLELAKHFDQRWARGVARILARMIVVTSQRVGVMGGDGTSIGHRPPTPSLPWQYGSVVR